MDIVLGVIIGIIVLTLLVVLHELGHALFARRYGVVVKEFGVGFPPMAWGKKLKQSFLGKNVLYSINWLPLGGFVRLKGEHDADHKPGDYGAATFWQKTKILLAGVGMNWLTAIVILTILSLFGIPKILPNQFSVPADTITQQNPPQITFVAKGSPAEKAGLKPYDEVKTIAGEPVNAVSDLTRLSKTHAGQTVDVGYIRGGQESTQKIALNKDNKSGQGFLGVGGVDRQTVRSTWSAPIVGVGLTAQLTWGTLAGLGDLVYRTGHNIVTQIFGSSDDKKTSQKDMDVAANSVAGPVGIFGSIFPAVTKAGPVYVLVLAAIISVSLAVMNTLPIPALDGGRWFVMAMFKLFKKPLSSDLEDKIHGYGFMALMGLVLLITVLDVGKLVR